MNLGLDGRVAAVAAGSKGLGRACALALAREGASVSICARGEDGLREAERLLARAGADSVAIRLDLNEADAAERFVAATVQRFGRLDVLVANNGGPKPATAAAIDDETYDDSWRGNVIAMVRLARAALPLMRARGWGRIIAITSTSGKQPIPGLVTSNATRAAVSAHFKTLADEVAAEGITVNCVAPGLFLTDRVRFLAEERARALGLSPDEAATTITGAGAPIGRVGDPAEFADVVAFLASERASYLTGVTLHVDGGLTRSTF